MIYPPLSAFDLSEQTRLLSFSVSVGSQTRLLDWLCASSGSLWRRLWRHKTLPIALFNLHRICLWRNALWCSQKATANSESSSKCASRATLFCCYYYYYYYHYRGCRLRRRCCHAALFSCCQGPHNAAKPWRAPARSTASHRASPQSGGLPAQSLRQP